MSDKTAIFSNENTESPLQVIRQTMSVALSDEGAARVSFATNRGKGSGAQVINVDDYADGQWPHGYTPDRLLNDFYSNSSKAS